MLVYLSIGEDYYVEIEVGIDTTHIVSPFLPFPYCIALGLKIIESTLPVFHFIHNIYIKRKEKRNEPLPSKAWKFYTQ